MSIKEKNGYRYVACDQPGCQERTQGEFIAAGDIPNEKVEEDVTKVEGVVKETPEAEAKGGEAKKEAKKEEKK